MTNSQLFIPEKIKVGFQARNDTYTGQLAYVIYYDNKGKLRKETSWESWRNKKLDPLELENVPTTGFVLNKGVGGVRQSWGWNTRNEYIRVYDPRNFEFEISVSNLLFILRECDCNKGKGLEGKFVYAWGGTELILLPEGCTDYQESQKHTALQSEKVLSKELVPGITYLTKRHEKLIYVGRYQYHSQAYTYDDPGYYGRGNKPDKGGVVKKYIFWHSYSSGGFFKILDSLSTLATKKSDEVSPELPELIDKYYKSAHGSKVVELFLKPVPYNKDGYHTKHWFVLHDGRYTQIHSNSHKVNQNHYWSNRSGYRDHCDAYWLENDKLNYHCGDPRLPSTPYPETDDQLFARLESGAEFQVRSNTFSK